MFFVFFTILCSSLKVHPLRRNLGWSLQEQQLKELEECKYDLSGSNDKNGDLQAKLDDCKASTASLSGIGDDLINADDELNTCKHTLEASAVEIKTLLQEKSDNESYLKYAVYSFEGDVNTLHSQLKTCKKELSTTAAQITAHLEDMKLTGAQLKAEDANSLENLIGNWFSDDNSDLNTNEDSDSVELDEAIDASPGFSSETSSDVSELAKLKLEYLKLTLERNLYRDRFNFMTRQVREAGEKFYQNTMEKYPATKD
jgi:chromosome segregation ATPase